MQKTLRAKSIGHVAHRWLERELSEARVQAVFRRACHLVTTDGRLMVLLAMPRRGPTNIVVPGLRSGLEDMRVGQRVSLSSRVVVVADAGLSIDLVDVPVWPSFVPPTIPVADAEVRQSHIVTAAALAEEKGVQGLVGLLPELIPGILGGLAKLPTAATNLMTTTWASVSDQALAAIGRLSRGARRRTADGFYVEARRLIGLGPGLTPSGDDFLTGMLLSLLYAGRASNGDVEWVWEAGERLAHAAVGRTTMVSEQQLWLAARGETDEIVGSAIKAMLWGENRLPTAIEDLLGVGSTSGGDMLTGICVASELLDDVLELHPHS